MASKGWDWTSTHSLESAAAWALKRAGPDALFVAIVRVNDLAIAADPLLKPEDVLSLVDDRRIDLHATLSRLRDKARAKAERKEKRGK